MKTDSLLRKPALLMSLLSIAAFHSAAALTPTLLLPTVPNSFDIVYKHKPYTALPAVQYNALVALAMGDGSVKRSTKKLGTTTYIVSAQSPTNFFNFDQATGALSFSRDLSKYEGDFVPTLPKTDDESMRVAIAYLTANKLLPAVAAGDSMIFAGVQTITAARPPAPGQPVPPVGANANVVSIDKLKIVTYRREIYGIPVMGPGSKIVVTIGDNNTVEGLILRWRPFIAPAKPPVTTGTTATAPSATTVTTSAPSITPAASLAALRAGIQKKHPEYDTFTIDNMVLTMDVGLYDSNQVAIQPVYVYQVDMNRKSKLPLPGTDLQELFLTASPYLKTPPEAIYQLWDISPSPLPKAAAQD